MKKYWISIEKQLPINGACVYMFNEFTGKEQIGFYESRNFLFNGLPITHVTHWKYTA